MFSADDYLTSENLIENINLMILNNSGTNLTENDNKTLTDFENHLNAQKKIS